MMVELDKQINVLIVEDSKTQAEWLKQTLIDVGMMAKCVDTLGAGIEAIRRESFDAIMLDLILPDSDGMATLQSIKSNSPALPIIVLTALEEDRVGLDSLKHGADDYLFKGETTPGGLIRSIRYAIERKSQSRAMKQMQRQTREIIERAKDAFLAVDLDGVIVDWNRKAQELFGRSRMEALGEDMVDLIIAPEHKALIREGLRSFKDTASGAIVKEKWEISGLYKNGALVPIEVGFFPVQTGEVFTLCSFVSDITNRKEIEQRMSEFYATVSHELRSPLTSIRGSLRLLEGGILGDLTEDALEVTTISISSCDRMLRLICDLLDMSKIEAGKMELDIKDVDPTSLVESAIAGIAGMAAAASVELKSDVSENRLVRADSDKLLQVLTNLMSNAIKFSPENSIVTVKTEPGVSDKVRFSVTDQGQGIPEEDLHKIFGKFQQLENASTVKYSGTGLGLAISKAIVAEHSGDIGVDSKVGTGTTFWFELPLCESQLRCMETNLLV